MNMQSHTRRCAHVSVMHTKVESREINVNDLVEEE
jgi:hypothetical protein